MFHERVVVPTTKENIDNFIESGRLRQKNGNEISSYFGDEKKPPFLFFFFFRTLISAS